mgnify:CR=1 FL=1
MEGYSFDDFEKILDDGYQVYFTYLKNRFLLFKSADNCYTQKLILVGQKNPPAKQQMVTKKYLNEIYPFMEEVEYKYETWGNFWGLPKSSSFKLTIDIK